MEPLRVFPDTTVSMTDEQMRVAMTTMATALLIDCPALLSPFATWVVNLDAERARLLMSRLDDAVPLGPPGSVASDHAATVGDCRAAARALGMVGSV